MRIIAGKLGGRLFDSPNTHRTHPMSDRVRGALFSILGDIEGLTVLDAFAGTGALAFEAASRGAISVTAIEQDRTAQKVIAKNISQLELSDTVQLISAASQAWLRTSEHQPYDIVLCDPPYDDVQSKVLQQLATLTSQNGTLVVSWPGSMDAPTFEGFEQVAARSYGDAQLFFFARR